MLVWMPRRYIFPPTPSHELFRSVTMVSEFSREKRDLKLLKRLSSISRMSHCGEQYLLHSGTRRVVVGSPNRGCSPDEMKLNIIGESECLFFW